MDWQQFENNTALIWNSLPPSTKKAVLNPTAETLGEALNGAATLICSPLLILGIATKAGIKKFSREINQKLSNIPEEHHDLSKQGLVVKAMEDARYQLSQDDIRHMYVNLIASTVDDRKSSMVNPRIASVLSQMGTREAKFIELLSTQKEHKLLVGQAWMKNYKEGYDYYIHPFLIIDDFLNYRFGFDSSIDILESMGIIKIFKNRKLTENKFQTKYETIKKTLQPLEDHKKDDEVLEIRLGYIEFTDFGNDFRQCIC